MFRRKKPDYERIIVTIDGKAATLTDLQVGMKMRATLSPSGTAATINAKSMPHPSAPPPAPAGR